MSPTGPCAICPAQKKSESEERLLSQPLATRLFHEECALCSSNDPVPDPGLCPFCRHLRLQHLICCIPDEEQALDFFITVCQFRDLPERASACSFCRLLARAALRYGYYTGRESISAYRGDSLAISFKRRGWIMTQTEGDRGWKHSRMIRHNGNVNAPAPVRDFGNWVVGRFVRWPLFRRWLKYCLEDHDHERAGPRADASTAFPANFRVIDIRKRRLVQMPPSCQFVALSYVWGSEPDPTKLFTTRSNINSLQEDGSLAVGDMPATINDAMEVCRQLREPYLWADRFCIVQDSRDDKAEQIAAMASIYSLAKLVIIVTDGNSDSGIPGVSRERSQGQVQEHIAGFDFSLDEIPTLKEVEGGCVWSTRSWTYQEAVLARRRLFLTESQAFCECQSVGLSERGSITSATSQYSPIERRNEPYHGTLLKAFFEHLDGYRRRSLTDVSDIYNAIDGVTTELYGGSGSLWRGLPRRDFDQALLWCIKRTRDPRFWTTAPTNKGTGPSWSWSVTDKEIRLLKFKGVFDVFSYCETLVAWLGIREGADSPTQEAVESLETVPGGKPLSHFHKGQDECGCPSEMSDGQLEQIFCAVIAWSDGLIKAPYPFAKLENTTFAALRSQIKSRWACRHDYWLEAFGDTVHLASFDDTHATIPCGPDIIFTWAQSALFSLQPYSNSRVGNGYLCIVDEAGEPAGLLIAGDNELDLKPGIARTPKFEFIALSMSTGDGTVSYHDGNCWINPMNGCPARRSLSRSPSPEERPSSPPPVLHVTVCDGEGKYLLPIPLVNVMLIERTGENRARRVTVGWIYLGYWVAAQPEFKMIYLE